MTKEERIEAEHIRLKTMQDTQREISGGAKVVFGIDEAGRGPLCGPVVAACCVLDEDTEILYLNDSKKLGEKKRELIYEAVLTKAKAYGIGTAAPKRIDEINILNATFEAMAEAYDNCRRMLKEKSGQDADGLHDAMVLIDGNNTVPAIYEPQISVVKGDAKCPAISAASVLAKVTRDRMMTEYDRLYPEYGIAKHKGYGTKEHITAILKYGITDIYRKSFLTNIFKDCKSR